ncbi:hypothetical protein [Brevundimonas sp.]|uniref:hypothetical protein n=1 Tax=Brevundimonas sp. TaxID=1871086 RepID=UPI002FCABAD4
MDGEIENELLWTYFFRYVHKCFQRLAIVGEPFSREAEHTGEIPPLAHAVVLRSLCSSDAIQILLDRHFLIDATTLARGLSEAEIFLGALRVKPVEAVERLRQDWFIGRVGHAKVVKDILEARPQDRREAAKVVSEAQPGQLIKWADFAKWVGDNRPYAVFKKILIECSAYHCWIIRQAH